MIRKQLLVILSLFIGITPFLAKMNSPKTKATSHKPLSLFDLTGEWVSDEDTVLMVKDDASVYLNDLPIQLIRKDSQLNLLILQDKFGYNITITKIDENKLTFHDEVEDATFIFHKK